MFASIVRRENHNFYGCEEREISAIGYGKMSFLEWLLCFHFHHLTHEIETIEKPNVEISVPTSKRTTHSILLFLNELINVLFGILTISIS